MSLYRPYQKCLPHPFPLTLPILSGFNTYSSCVWAIQKSACHTFSPSMLFAILNDYNTYMYGSCVHVCAIQKRAVVAVVSLINPLSPNIHIQILQTDLHTFPLRISWENLIKHQSIFSSVIIFYILTTLPLDNVWILLGENCCWSPWGLKGVKWHTNYHAYNKQ